MIQYIRNTNARGFFEIDAGRVPDADTVADVMARELGIPLETVFSVCGYRLSNIHFGESVNGRMLFMIPAISARPLCLVKLNSGGVVVASATSVPPCQILLIDCLSGVKTGRSLKGHTDDIRTIVPYSSSNPHGCDSRSDEHDMLFSASGSIRAWDLKSRKEKAVFRSYKSHALSDLCIDPFETRLISSDFADGIRIWSIENQCQIQEISEKIIGHTNSVSFGNSSEYRYIFTCSDDGTTKMIDANERVPLSKAFDHHKFVRCCCLGLENHLLWTGCGDGSVWAWDVRNESSRLNILNKLHSREVRHIKRESEDKLISCSDKSPDLARDNPVKIFDSSLKLKSEVDTNFGCFGLAPLSGFNSGRYVRSFERVDEEERTNYVFSCFSMISSNLLTIRFWVDSGWGSVEVGCFRSFLI